MSSTSSEDLRRLRDLFTRVDVHGVGLLARAAFVEVLARSAIPTDEADHLFTCADQDASGFVTCTEFVAAAMPRRVYMDEDNVRAAFRRFDLAGTGRISRANLASVLGSSCPPDRLADMMADADTDRDGSIDMDEFLAVLHRGVGPLSVGDLEPRFSRASSPAEVTAASLGTALAAAGAAADGVDVDADEPVAADDEAEEGNEDDSLAAGRHAGEDDVARPPSAAPGVELHVQDS